ncbi:PQQ-binding-like beta-propeller repeat protein [soil metagenome]
MIPMTSADLPRIILAAAASLLLPLGPASAEVAWPQFRGPQGDGTVPGSPDLPTQWSETENVAWKTPLDGRAWSTPAIGDNQVWMTNANPEGTQLSAVCLDFRNGDILHQTVLFKPTDPEPLGNPVNSYGSPSPVLEPGRVYLHFGSYGTACLDTRSADILWERSDLPCRHLRGPGSSPVPYKGTLILTMDGVDVQYLVALDKQSGETVWRTERTTDFDDLDPEGKPKAEGDFRKAYTTPLLVAVPNTDRTWIVSPGAKAAYAYDADTGEEIWKVTYGGFSNASAPVATDTHLFLNTGFGNADILAVRIDPAASGDITGSHIDWKTDDRTPLKPSPVITGDGILVTVNDGGIATAYDAATGEQHWSERLGGKFSASPVLVDQTAYVPNEMGDTYVFSATKDFDIIATNSLDSGSFASPAVAGNSLIIRTTSAVYRIQKK